MLRSVAYSERQSGVPAAGIRRPMDINRSKAEQPPAERGRWRHFIHAFNTLIIHLLSIDIDWRAMPYLFYMFKLSLMMLIQLIKRLISSVEIPKIIVIFVL